MRLRAILVCVFFAQVVLGQVKYDANWVFGDNIGIDFNDTNSPTLFSTFTVSGEPNACISDSNGQLLFYLSAGGGYYAEIRDKSDSIIVNGDSLKINYSITNGGIILPFSNKWLFFHVVGVSGTLLNAGYSVIKLDSVTGFYIDQKNVPLSGNFIEEKVAAVKHANGKDWWVVFHRSTENASITTNTFYKFLVTEDTIVGPMEQQIGLLHSTLNSAIGEMTFSRQGSYLINVMGDERHAELFRFNRCTGELYDFKPLMNASAGGSLYGCEFSADETKVYLGEEYYNGNSFKVYQYDLTAIDVSASKTIVGTDTSSIPMYTISQMELAPDGRIYLASYTENFLSTINHPDSLGVACDFQLGSFSLGTTARTEYGLPNFPNYNLGPTEFYQANAGKDTLICNITSIQLGTPAQPNLTYQWQPTATLDSPNTAQPIASPTEDTYYILTITDTSSTASASCRVRMDTVFVDVEICSGIEEEKQGESEVKIYPNPANDQLFIELPANETGSFTLYNIMGQMLHQQSLTLPQTLLDISTLPEGLYLYRIGQYAGKVQVVR